MDKNMEVLAVRAKLLRCVFPQSRFIECRIFLTVVRPYVSYYAFSHYLGFEVAWFDVISTIKIVHAESLHHSFVSRGLAALHNSPLNRISPWAQSFLWYKDS